MNENEERERAIGVAVRVVRAACWVLAAVLEGGERFLAEHGGPEAEHAALVTRCARTGHAYDSDDELVGRCLCGEREHALGGEA